MRGGADFSLKERYEIGSMLTVHELHKGPACKPIGDWLVGMAQRTWPRWSGVAFFHRTNVRRLWTVISYHHPARLCWSWSIKIGLFQDFYGKGFGRFWRSYRGNWHLIIPFVVEISWTRQSYDWMLSSTAKKRLSEVALYNIPMREAA